MKKHPKGIVVVLLLLVAILMSSVNLTGAQEPKILKTANLPGDVILDPALGHWVQEIQIINMMFIGLTTFDETTAELQPGVATDWTVSDDGLTYTFHMMDNIPWVRYDQDAGEVVQVMDDSGSPRLLNAQDVVYGINRTLDPATGSQYASLLSPWIVGGAEKLAGEAAQLSVTAVDDFTVEIVTPRAAAYLPYIYGLWLARPQPQWVIEEFGDAWTEVENFVAYGPYTLKTYDHDVAVAIVKNPFWPGTEAVPQAIIDEHQWVYLDEPSALAAYEAGEIDWINYIPPADLDRLRVDYPEELTIAPDICTYYYGFNVAIPPTDNVHMRRALSMAIDRQTIVTITNGGEVPAGFYTRPDVAAAPTEELYPDLAIKSDAEAAKAELQLYLEETGQSIEDVPAIQLMHNTSQRHATIAQAVQQMWKETLGVEVQITAQDANVYNETLRRDPPNVWRLGWCWDYPDAASFINDVFRTKGEDSNNHTNWGTDEFYALLDQAGVEPDYDVRRDLYAQAEYMLVNQDAAIAPIYFYTIQQLTKPYVVRSFALDKLERLNKWDIAQ